MSGQTMLKCKSKMPLESVFRPDRS